STVTAIMPAESSSVIQNSTNGIEPPKSLMIAKKSKSGIIRLLVPDIDKYSDQYTMAYDMNESPAHNNRGYINIVALFQKWFDMSISANLYYDYAAFDSEKIPLSIIANDILYAYKMGLKTIYYSMSNDGNEDVN